MSVVLPRRSFAALSLVALIGVSLGPVHAQAAHSSFSGTVVAARPASIVVRSSSGISTYTVSGSIGIVLAAGMRGTPDAIAISGELERGVVTTFGTSTMKIVAADVAPDQKTVDLVGGGSVLLDWGITKPMAGKSLVFVGRLVGGPGGVTFIVASDPLGGH